MSQTLNPRLCLIAQQQIYVPTITCYGFNSRTGAINHPQINHEVINSTYDEIICHLCAKLQNKSARWLWFMVILRIVSYWLYHIA